MPGDPTNETPGPGLAPGPDPWHPEYFTPVSLEELALESPPTGEVAADTDPTPEGGITRPAKRKRYWLRRTVFALGALLLLGVGYYGVTLYQVWSTGRHDQAREADAIVVMGAANYNGRPSPLLKARLDHALDLYQQQLAPLIVVTGGKQAGDKYTEAEASRRYLKEQGVPDSAILSEESGHSTWQSMEGVVALLSPQGDHPRVLIVTDPFHSLRSRLIAQELGLTAYTSPTRTSPWGSGTQFKKSMKEAAGIALGRIIGFHRLWKVTG